YSETSFEFSVVELATESKLLQVEQMWIDKTRCADRKIGFNIYPVAGSPGNANAQVWKGFIDPQGNEITITNLHSFCRQQRLDFPSMHRLAAGKSKLKSYKGWTHKNSPRLREHVKTYDGFIAPNGCHIGPIINLAAFCRKHDLDNTHMVAVAKGRIYSHRGWTFANDLQKCNSYKTYTGFINPDGQRTVIINLQAFCREHGLMQAHMHEIKNGKRRSHKGWTWSKDQ
ncbi:MAG: hypothetical protein WCB68_18065, partial [Pyrinomonadaceae bacterium]